MGRAGPSPPGFERRATAGAFLIGLTRIQGCLLAVPLAWEVFRQWRAGRRLGSWALVPLLPGCSLALFLGYSQILTGTTTLQTQRTVWGNSTQPPWTLIALSWQRITRRGDSIEALNLMLLVLFIVILLAGLRRVPFSYTLYAAPQLLLLATDQRFVSPLASTTRHLMVLFPIFTVWRC